MKVIEEVFIDKKNNSKIENIIYLTTITFSPNDTIVVPEIL